MADELLKKEFMLLFFFPVVPKDKARIRVQLSAAQRAFRFAKSRHLLKLANL
jgi:7-keto-8-aminopelargonate synthetase-like enzyme